MNDMNDLTVSLFGHREIHDLYYLEKTLAPIIKGLMKNEAYVSFLIGRNGDFDEIAASVIKSAQKETELKNSDLTLVLPYSVSNVEYYERYYDSIIIPDSLHNVHPKAAITLKNQWMVERSELVIAYVGHRNGGAYKAMKYAQKLNKKVINIFP